MQFLDPQKVVAHFSIAPGMHVAELHAGSGHFTSHIKKAVGTYGIVHSLQHENRSDHIELPELVDRVMIINIPLDAHHHSVLSRAYRLLKPHGKVILIESRGGRLTPERATDFAGIAGFLREKHFHAGEHHFGLVFKRI